VSAPLILPRFDPATLAELRQRYEDAPNGESRTRYHILLLAQQGYKVPQIARMVLRSEDTVARVFHRFLAAGLDAVPRRTPPGRKRRVSAAWEAELLRVIDVDPHTVGQETANWTTELLAVYLGQQTGIHACEETVRVYLHAHEYVCKRPTWTLRRKAGEQADDVGNECGERWYWQAPQNRYPFMTW
jgi:transposase